MSSNLDLNADEFMYKPSCYSKIIPFVLSNEYTKVTVKPIFTNENDQTQLLQYMKENELIRYCRVNQMVIKQNEYKTVIYVEHQYNNDKEVTEVIKNNQTSSTNPRFEVFELNDNDEFIQTNPFVTPEDYKIMIWHIKNGKLIKSGIAKQLIIKRIDNKTIVSADVEKIKIYDTH